MYSIKNTILYFIVLIAAIQIQGLVELQKDKDLAVTEAAVRKTVNSIFAILKLDHEKHKARFGEFAAIHNFFVTITFQDDDNLKEIAKLARVENIDNNTHHFITQLNEVLNEDNKSYEATEDEYVETHIATFIRKLEYLKFKYGFANNAAKFGINTQVLNHLISDDTLLNVTKSAREINITNSNLLNRDEFWNPSASRRIYEGQKATIKRYPFMASIQFFKKFQCGGSIIKSDLVITSASCLQLAWNNRFFRENPAFLSVQVGCDLYESCGENIPILEVYFHPEYNPKNLKNNLAIMRLVMVLKFGKRVKKIKKIDFDRQPSPLSENTPGITIIGWGARHSSNIVLGIWKNRLSYALLDFYPLRECQEVYSKEFVSHKNFCAGFLSKGGGACNRDAGGPGVAGGKLIGVVSFGAPNCGAPDAPTVFTKIGFYTDWIEGILEMKAPSRARSTTPRLSMQKFEMNSLLLSTETHFKIAPITQSPLPPVPSEEALRSLDENDIFKEFITTMFGSDEVKEYLDQFESDTGGSYEVTSKATTKDISRVALIKPTTTTTTTEADIGEQVSEEYENPEDQKGSVRMVTTIDNFDEVKVQEPIPMESIPDEDIENDQKDTTPTPMESIPDEDIDEEEQEEKNIAKLIDDLDIQELLASDSKEKSSETAEVFESKEPKRYQETNTYKKQETEEVEIIEDTVERPSDTKEHTTLNSDKESPSNDSSDDVTYEEIAIVPAPSQIDKEPPSNTIKKDKKVKNQYAPFFGQSSKKEEKEFKDATFRQNGTGGILNIFSRDDLLKLFHEAVVDAAAQKPDTAAASGEHIATPGFIGRRDIGLVIPAL